ncbi:MAG TPA: IPT/TIG domain-containing protein [Candidatus Paceibacterota bacterium]|nr:IPT/TIG domain-containing protein [Candidatus Paceibacterota bacterium]
MNYKTFAAGAVALSLAFSAVVPFANAQTASSASSSGAASLNLKGAPGTILPIAIHAPCFALSRNLRAGLQGDDVKQLQMMLNSATDTQVATSGAGSPGNETTYFGPATLRAVIKFQNKYKADILAPVGLSQGTGFVGSSTLAHLRLIFPCMPGGDQGNGTTTAPTIVSMSPLFGPIGTKVTLTGSGFASTTRVKFGTGQVTDIDVESSTTLSFRVPEGSGVYCGPGMMCPMIYMLFKPGTYEVSVANMQAMSNSVKFEITGPTATTPKVPAASGQ